MGFGENLNKLTRALDKLTGARATVMYDDTRKIKEILESLQQRATGEVSEYLEGIDVGDRIERLEKDLEEYKKTKNANPTIIEEIESRLRAIKSYPKKYIADSGRGDGSR